MRLHFAFRILVTGPILIGAFAAGATALVAASKETKASKEMKVWTERFELTSCAWASRGRNEFFILEPGYQQILDSAEGKVRKHVEITVLDETKMVGAVETRIVEEKESRNGEIVEISRNFYALCGPGNDAFYFGEDVEVHADGGTATSEGSWRAGAAGAKPGLAMPSTPLLGARYYQELAPGVAMDRMEIVGDAEPLETPAGYFRDCLKTEETSPLEPDDKAYKIYARGIGIVKDEELVLTKYGFINKKNP